MMDIVMWIVILILGAATILQSLTIKNLMESVRNISNTVKALAEVKSTEAGWVKDEIERIKDTEGKRAAYIGLLQRSIQGAGLNILSMQKEIDRVNKIVTLVSGSIGTLKCNQCGSNEIYSAPIIEDGKYIGFIVRCDACGNEVRADTEEESISKWNTDRVGW